jgi:hypothetical protein
MFNLGGTIPTDWKQNIATKDWWHQPTQTSVPDNLIQTHGFPPDWCCNSTNDIRGWYFTKLTGLNPNSPAQNKAVPIPANALDQEIVECQKNLDEALRRMSPSINYLQRRLAELEDRKRAQTYQSRTAAAMNQMKQQQIAKMAQNYKNYIGHHYDWLKSDDWIDEFPPKPTELLLSVASYTDRIPASVTYTVSLEWLRCRISKDSDWLSCSPVKSPQHIKLWEKDFILIQTTLPGSEVIKEVKIGFRLNKVGTTRHVLEPLPQYPGLVVGDVPFLCISDLK